MLEWIAGVVDRFVTWSEDVVAANRLARRYERESVLPERALRRRGLRRDQIAAHMLKELTLH